MYSSTRYTWWRDAMAWYMGTTKGCEVSERMARSLHTRWTAFLRTNSALFICFTATFSPVDATSHRNTREAPPTLRQRRKVKSRMLTPADDALRRWEEEETRGRGRRLPSLSGSAPSAAAAGASRVASDDCITAASHRFTQRIGAMHWAA